MHKILWDHLTPARRPELEIIYKEKRKKKKKKDNLSKNGLCHFGGRQSENQKKTCLRTKNFMEHKCDNGDNYNQCARHDPQRLGKGDWKQHLTGTTNSG